MLVFDFFIIGERIYAIRHKKGMTRFEVSEKADISDRNYANIERGTVDMRLSTFLKICKALNVKPNDILLSDEKEQVSTDDIMNFINNCSASERQTALNLLSVYLQSLN